MDTAAQQYTVGIHQAEEKLLPFLRTIEAYQEELQMSRLDAQRRGLEDIVGDLFHGLKIDLATLTPPDQLKDVHTTFSKAVEHCAEAYGSFVSAVGRDFAIRFLKLITGEVGEWLKPHVC